MTHLTPFKLIWCHCLFDYIIPLLLNFTFYLKRHKILCIREKDHLMRWNGYGMNLTDETIPLAVKVCASLWYKLNWTGIPEKSDFYGEKIHFFYIKKNRVNINCDGCKCIKSVLYLHFVKQTHIYLVLNRPFGSLWMDLYKVMV